MTPDEPLIGQLRDPDAETVSTGRWLAETELVDEPVADVAFIVAGTDIEREALRHFQKGTALMLMEHILALYGLKLVAQPDAADVVELAALHGSLWFREYYVRDEHGQVSRHGKPVTDMPGWVVAFEDERKPKIIPTCYVCGEKIKPGEVVVPHKHPISGVSLIKHAADCMA